jgi:hypothetical protein
MDGIIEELRQRMAQVRLGLEPDGAGWVVTWEKERHPVAALPLDHIDERAREAELLAVAAGIEAAVKLSAQVRDEAFGQGAASLLPRLERARFALAYDAVMDGRGGDDGERLCWDDVGAGLIAAYVSDAGWSFTYVSRAQAARWGATGDRLSAAARSGLYARAEVDWSELRVTKSDGYDASRVLIAGDVFFHKATSRGIDVAVPGRDLRLVAEAAGAEASERAYAEARYPLCPVPLRIERGRLSER